MSASWIDVPLPAGLRLGTSSYYWAEWHGPFYPVDLPVNDRLSWYATQFDTVEIDATFYRSPSRRQVSGWALKTPPEFLISLKVPRTITHDAGMVDCDAETAEFLSALEPLGPRQGPLLLQFPYVAKSVNRHEYESGVGLRRALAAWLPRWAPHADWVVEVRNLTWIDRPLIDLLAEHEVSLAFNAYYTMPNLTSLFEQDRFDPLTGRWAYVRFLGDHRRLDRLNDELVADGAKPEGYCELIVDRERELRTWVDALLPVLGRRPVLAYFNNHYAGFGPGSARMFARLWDEIHGA
ncbi:MAG TPA: hypothetical protein DCZ72_07270 [Armatimonadetes bacterium]|nr:hypothetical protein [Armatimonadota bacterium]